MLKYEKIEEPLISFVSWAYDGHTFYTYTFSVKNQDEFAATIYADTNTTPTTSKGIIASQSSVSVDVVSTGTSATLYARAKANGKNYSTVDSAEGTIT